MGRPKHWRYWLVMAITASSMGMLWLSCKTKTPSEQSNGMSADVQLISRIGRAVNRYRSALELASYAQTAVERSLAEQHWQIHRDILKLEFLQAKLEIGNEAALKSKEKQATQTGGIQRQDSNVADETARINSDINNAKQLVALAELKRKKAKSTREIEQTQAALTRAQKILEIANKEMNLHETNLKIADQQRKDSDNDQDKIRSLKEKITSLEKESLGKDATGTPVLKGNDQINTTGDGLMGAFRSWWTLYDKGQVLDQAGQRAERLLDNFKNSQLENKKYLGKMQSEQRDLNRQIQLLYSQANELLKQAGQDDKTSTLLEEADAKIKESLSYSQRKVQGSQNQVIFQRKFFLAAEDKGKLASWRQVVANSRARAQARLLQRLGTLFGMMFVVFLAAYLLKKIPKRFAKEEKSAYYFRKLIGFAAWLIVILMVIFNVAGGIGSISAVIGLAGAGLAIALQDPIVSLVGWFLVVGKHGISVGDRVEINGVKGDVADVGMLRIAVLEVGNWLSGEQATGRMVFFPNSFIFKGHFFNYSTANSFIWDEIRILVTYESQWKKARDIILKVAEEVSHDVVGRARVSQEKLSQRFHLSIGNPESYAYVNIADSGVDLVLRYLTEITLRRIMHDRICVEILEAFEKEKDIQLAYPTQRQLNETRIINASNVAE